MSFDPLTAAFDLGKVAIEKLFPDPNKRAEEVRKLEELRQKGEAVELNAQVSLMLAQIDVNKEEAKSGSWWTSGWRPGVGWVGVVSLAMAYIPKALVITIMWTLQCWNMYKHGNFTVLPPFPDLGLMDILGLLGSILGVGTLRSFDKTKGTQTDSIGKG